MTGIDVSELKPALQARIVDLVQHLFPAGRREGSTYRIGNLAGDPGGSLSIELVDPARRGVWIDHAADGRGDVIALIQGTQGLDFRGALEWGAAYLGWPAAERSDLTQRLRQGTERLLAHEAAMAYLTGPQRGLSRETIKVYHLGLHTMHDGATRQLIYADALSYPLLDRHGQAQPRYLRSRIPDVTLKEGRARDWATGETSTYWVTPDAGQPDLLICEGIKDGWRLAQELPGDLKARLCIISSTHGKVIPQEWCTPDSSFFGQWERVYLAHDNDQAGDKIANSIAELCGHKAQRLMVPREHGKDWTEFFADGGDIGKLRELLDDLEVLESAVLADSPTPKGGLRDIHLIDVARDHQDGLIFYPFKAACEDLSGGRRQLYLKDLVLRSDGRIFTPSLLPAPKGTPVEDRILALDDEIFIEPFKVCDKRIASLSFSDIQLYVEYRSGDTSSPSLGIAQILESIEEHLKSTAVLPYEHDYAILIYTILLSYLQQVFDAVPLLLLVGVSNSGKSELAVAVSNLSCNSTVLSEQTSAASFTRIADETAGLIVLDDLESIARAGGDREDFNSLAQMLKVSYKKSTAHKVWTDVKSMRTHRLNFYGIKVITNTEGVTGILGSRMLKIYTRKVPRGQLVTSDRGCPLSTEQRRNVRAQLHYWAFEHCQRAYKLYLQKYSQHNTRSAEITAPLRLLAEITGHERLAGQLRIALARQEDDAPSLESSGELLRQAARELVRRGHRHHVTITDLIDEMMALGGSNFGRTSTTEIPEWQQPRWIGRQLRNLLIVDSAAKEGRSRINGRHVRIQLLEPSFVEQTLQELAEAGQEVLDPIEQGS